MLTTAKIQSRRIVTEFPVFYGWVVLAAATLGMVLPLAGYNSVIGFFIDDFIVEFGLSRTALSVGLGVCTLTASLLLPWLGRLADRYGGRVTGLVAGVLYGISLVLLATATGPLMFFLMFLFMRAVGVRPLEIINATVIAQWFRNNRGRIISVTVIAVWLTQSVLVPWVQRMVEVHDWREIWRFMGIIIALALVPLIWLLIRDRPEEYGLRPDGASVDDVIAEDEDDWTLAEARRTMMFWVIACGRTLMPALGSSLVLHQVSVFSVLGHDASVAAQVFSAVAVVGAVGSIGAGYVMDRLRPGLMMILQLGVLTVAALLAMTMTETWMLALYALVFGLSVSIGRVFDNSVWANLFGRKCLTEIRGFTTLIMTIGLTLGPILFGWNFDTFGNYNLVLGLFAVLSFIQMILAYIAPRPQRPEPVTTP